MIRFETIRWQNFLSTGNVFTEVDLGGHKSTLIVGANGNGKSTMIDALCYVLYDRPYRKVPKTLLVNSITKKKLLVEVEFKIGSNHYMVRRGMRPSVFEIYINGELCDKESGDQNYLEKSILKMNLKTFIQIVIITARKYIQFMDLPAGQRRELVEEVLDLKIFTAMSTLLKSRLDTVKQQMAEVEANLQKQTYALDLIKKHRDEMQRNTEALVDSKREKIAQLQEIIIAERSEVRALKKQIDTLEQSIVDLEEVTKGHRQAIEQKASCSQQIRELKNRAMFFSTHDDCPTCHQAIGEDLKTRSIEHDALTATELVAQSKTLTVQIEKHQQRLEEINETRNQLYNLKSEVGIKNMSIDRHMTHISNIESEIEDLKKQSSTSSEALGDPQELRQQLREAEATKQSLIKQKAVIDYVVPLLKDSGTKTQIIEKYIPLINKLINRYLTTFEFLCDFNLDSEFEETIRSRHRDEFVYHSFSEGEKMRIDLSILMTWRAIAKVRNAASTNLLIFDESFDSSMDTQGVDTFAQILSSLTDEQNVFVISHGSAELFGTWFARIIQFRKINNFSQYELIDGAQE